MDKKTKILIIFTAFSVLTFFTGSVGIILSALKFIEGQEVLFTIILLFGAIFLAIMFILVIYFYIKKKGVGNK